MPWYSCDIPSENVLSLPTVSNSVSGSIANFNTSLALPLVALKAYIQAQGGGGTPSSPVAIVGWNSVKIGQTSGSTDVATYFRGLIQGTYDFVDLGSLTWAYSSASAYFYAKPTNLPKITPTQSIPNLLCPIYTPATFASMYNQPTGADMVSCLTNGGYYAQNIYIRNKAYTDETAFKTAMSGVYMIYELDTPITPTITEAQFATLCTAFGITGNTFTISLGQTIYGGYVDWELGKLVLDKVCVTLDSSKNWVKNNQILTSNAYISSPNNQFPDYKREDGKCSHFEVASSSAASSGVFFGGSINILTPLDMNLDTPDKFKEWITNNTVQVLYSLTTPIEIDLPKTMPSTITGVQNWFADSGDIEVAYWQTIKDKLGV